MSIHERSGHWHYRFKLKGVPYAKTTGLVATKQNRNAAKAKEAHARLEAEKGLKKSHTDDVPFQIASSEFLNWCQSTEYRRKPNTAKRISGSFTSLSEFFKSFTVRNVDAAAIERYKTFRSSEHQVKEVTLR